MSNNLSANLSQLTKTLQSGGFLGLKLMKNVLRSLAKSVIIPLGIIAAALVTCTRIHKTFLVKAVLWT